MSILIEDLLFINEMLNNRERDFYKNSVVMITGCAGSLGFELLHYLVEFSETKKIIGIDNCCLGYPNWLKRLVDKGEIDFYQEDISLADLSKIRDADKVNIIFHMASVASPVSYRSNPIATMDANVGGCRNLLNYYKDRNISNFCYFSSSEIYGSPDEKNIPTNESYFGNVNSVGPRACYDEAKRYSETLCYVFAQKYNVPCTIVRPFNIFGPGMKLNDKRISADCIESILCNENIKLFSDGTPTRTFCYVSDAIVWILKAATNEQFEVFNIGMDEPELTILQYAELCAEIGAKKLHYDKKVELKVSDDGDYLTDNPFRRCPDLTYSELKLHYRPKISTQAGIERFIDFFSDYNEKIKEEWSW